MRSLILQTSTRLLQPLILFFSFFLLVRGHDEPGGGFVGGLTAAAAFVLHAMAYGHASARRALFADPRAFSAIGLSIAGLTGVLPIAMGGALLQPTWVDVPLGPFGVVSLGTPLLFDVGVYLVVLGSTLMVVLALGEE